VSRYRIEAVEDTYWRRRWDVYRVEGSWSPSSWLRWDIGTFYHLSSFKTWAEARDWLIGHLKENA